MARNTHYSSIATTIRSSLSFRRSRYPSSNSSVSDRGSYISTSSQTQLMTLNSIMQQRPSVIHLEEEQKIFATGLNVLEPRPVVYWGGMEETMQSYWVDEAIYACEGQLSMDRCEISSSASPIRVNLRLKRQSLFGINHCSAWPLELYRSTFQSTGFTKCIWIDTRRVWAGFLACYPACWHVFWWLRTESGGQLWIWYYYSQLLAERHTVNFK